MEKKKLLVTGSTFPRWEGDTEPRFILDYAKAMTKYYEVTALVPAAPGAESEEMLEGVHVVRFHYFPIHKFETLCYPGAIVPRIREKKVRGLLVPFLLLSQKTALKKYSKKSDIVHAHWLVPQGIMQSKIQSIPYIVTGHGGDVTSLNFWPVKNLKKRTMERAAAITVVSGALRDYIQEIYPNDKTHILSMGCDTSAFSPEHKREHYFDQQDLKVVLFVGRLAEKKGVTYLIEAMKNVNNALLVIVGGGPLEADLKAQVKQEALEEKVKFLGPKSHEELPELYASADLFAGPSVTAKDGDKEGFGLVFLEAMASGTPVVATYSGGIPDVITSGKNGTLVEEKNSAELANAINELLANKELREEYIKNGLETSRQFSYEVIAEKYNSILENVLDKEQSSCLKK